MKSWIDRLHERFASSSIKKNQSIEDLKKWRKYLEELDDPKDVIEASYMRYECRMYHFSKTKRFIMNLFGFVAFFVEFVYIFTAKDHNHDKVRGKVVVERARDIPDFSDVGPQEILDGNDQVEIIDNFNKKFAPLCKTARKYLIRCIMAHPFSFFYIYFVYMELATHSYILLKYNPETVFVYINERNIASPILTEMYEMEGRSFCSFMHGEYQLELIMAFMAFSKYYIWDKSYVKLFKDDLRCQIKEFIVYTPKKLIKKWNIDKEETTYFCTYYFSGESEESIRTVAKIIQEFSKLDRKCSIRPHPRDLRHKKIIEETFGQCDGIIENVRELSLRDSLSRTKYVIGLQSTVLSEAYVEGKTIVLDDFSDKEQFEKLKMQKFNVFNKPHLLLSELLKNEIGDLRA